MKRITNDEVAMALGKMADRIRRDMDYDFRVARSQMWIAEKDLIDSLNDEQRTLYDDYRCKRDEFYRIAGEIYQRKF